jgi:hypothetical protein
MGDEVLQRRRRGLRRALAPERVNYAIDRDDSTGVEEQEREQRALLLAAKGDRMPVFEDLERTEDSELEHLPFLAPSKSAA